MNITFRVGILLSLLYFSEKSYAEDNAIKRYIQKGACSQESYSISEADNYKSRITCSSIALTKIENDPGMFGVSFTGSDIVPSVEASFAPDHHSLVIWGWLREGAEWEKGSYWSGGLAPGARCLSDSASITCDFSITADNKSGSENHIVFIIDNSAPPPDKLGDANRILMQAAHSSIDAKASKNISIPKLDVEGICSKRAHGIQNVLNACIASNQKSYNFLGITWNEYYHDIKYACGQVAQFAPSPGYDVMESCILDAQRVKESVVDTQSSHHFQP